MTPEAPFPPWHAGWVGRGLLAVAVVFLLKEAQPLLLPVASAVVLTFVLSPSVRWLRRRGLPEYGGALLLVATLVGGSLLVGSALVQPASQWWDRAPSAIDRLLERFDQLRKTIPLLAPPPPQPASEPAAAASAARAKPRPKGIDIHVAEPPPPPRDPLKERIASESLALTGAVLGRAVSFGLSLAATVILLYFLLASEHWMIVRTVEAIPKRRDRAIVLCAVRAAQRQIAVYIGAVAVINLVVAALTALAMMWIGLPNPVLWGTTAAVLAFIPYLGPLLITLLLLLAGSVTFGTGWEMLGPPAAFLVLHGIEANFLSPLIMGHRLQVRPVFVFLAVMVWGWLWGIAGAFLAVPLLLGLRAVCKRTRTLRVFCHYLEGD